MSEKRKCDGYDHKCPSACVHRHYHSCYDERAIPKVCTYRKEGYRERKGLVSCKTEEEFEEISILGRGW